MVVEGGVQWKTRAFCYRLIVMHVIMEVSRQTRVLGLESYCREFKSYLYSLCKCMNSAVLQHPIIRHSCAVYRSTTNLGRSRIRGRATVILRTHWSPSVELEVGKKNCRYGTTTFSLSPLSLTSFYRAALYATRSFPSQWCLSVRPSRREL